jgi:hypothetical protein
MRKLPHQADQSRSLYEPWQVLNACFRTPRTSRSITRLDEIKRILETVLLASSGPMSLVELKRVFEVELSNDFLRRALEALRADWQGRGVELVQLADGWRFPDQG